MALLIIKALLLRKYANRKRKLDADEANEERDSTELDTIGGLKSLENKTCRVCRGAGEIDIFSSYQERNLADDIHKSSGIPVYKSDGLPKWLCTDCLQLLQHAVKFREMCQESADIFLNGKLDRNKEESHGGPDYTGEYFIEELAAPPTPEDDTLWDTLALKTCYTCKEQFDDMVKYRRHVRECRRRSVRGKMKRIKVKKDDGSRQKEHLCETCGKSLSSIHSLISHRTIHQNIFPFKCDLCPYRGKTAGLLRTHRKVHFSEKPHACSQCGKAFRTASNLQKHMHTHKGLLEPVQCVLCEKTLRNKDTLRNHINSVHVQLPPVNCNICGKQYKATRALYKHRIKAHNWRAEFSGRLPSYMLCQPEDTEPASEQHIPEQSLAIAEP